MFGFNLFPRHSNTAKLHNAVLMASQAAGRSVQTLARSSGLCCMCASTRFSRQFSFPARQFSSTTSRPDEHQAFVSEKPRWSFTPPRTVSPVSIRRKPKDPKKAFESNSNPKKLDEMYIKFLGDGGDKVLSDEVKWLAVTHKSFDQGRRGFNDRLAFFGKRILLLQSTLNLFNSPLATSTQSQHDDPWGREPFQDPALAGLGNLNDVDIPEALSQQRLSQLAQTYGIGDVTRWKPKNPANMKGSGCDIVYTASLLAVLGAVSLQKGGEMANTIARERILKPLGL